MEPLSLTTRRIISTTFFVLFVAVLVVASVYASGYRLRGFELERTGGINVSVPITDARVLLDGAEVGMTGFLTRSFFIDNLEVGNYEIEVQADGYHTWKKTFVVDRALVTDAGAFMVPMEFELLPIVATTSESVATTTRVVSQDGYQSLLGLFNTTTSTPEAIGEPEALESVVRDGNVYVKWNQLLTNAPSAFCIRPDACVLEISVEYGEEEAVEAALYGGGVVYQTEDGVIFLSEIDVKHPQLVVPLYESGTAEFRIYENEIVILDGEEFFVVTGL